MKPIFTKGILMPAMAALAIILPISATAGPPFATDDPAPLPYHTGESYLFTSGSHAADGTTLDAAPGIETNFSFIRNTFLHVVVPVALDRPPGGPSVYGIGDIELGLKWRFVVQTDNRPDIGIFPFLELPTGDKDRGLGAGEVQAFFPVWLEKDVGPWTSYGGGGYWINPGDGNKDWWFTGILLQRQFTDRLYLGGEVFHQTADVVGGSAITAFNIGGGLTVSAPYQILFSAGRNIDQADENLFSFYAALYRTI